MTQIYANPLASVDRPPTLLMLLPGEHKAWCEQYAQEGYNVVHAIYPPTSKVSVTDVFKEAQAQILKLGADWALVSFGLSQKDASKFLAICALSMADLRASVHFCPTSETRKGYLIHDEGGRYIPTTFHLAASQETLHASLLPLTDVNNLGYPLPVRAHPPIKVYTYPLVSASPPFPLSVKPPASYTAYEGKTTTETPYLISAAELSRTRTLETFKKFLGPHFDLEIMWDKHTHFEFVERDAAKTMATMVPAPYVNHVATMVGGVGFDELTRFYKYHFCAPDVTPPDTELITVSRTVGANKIIEEMIYKCTHTTEIDYFLPGVAPTGRPLEIALVGIVAFRGDKIFFEHLYWDQASVLVQLGLLDPTNLPVAGVEVARKVLDPFGLPSNTLLAKWKESEGKSII